MKDFFGKYFILFTSLQSTSAYAQMEVVYDDAIVIEGEERDLSDRPSPADIDRGEDQNRERSRSANPSSVDADRYEWLESAQVITFQGEPFHVSPETSDAFFRYMEEYEGWSDASLATAILSWLPAILSMPRSGGANELAITATRETSGTGAIAGSNLAVTGVQAGIRLNEVGRRRLLFNVRQELRRAKRLNRLDLEFWQRVKQALEYPEIYNPDNVQRSPDGHFDFLPMISSAFRNVNYHTATISDLSLLAHTLQEAQRVSPSFDSMMDYVDWVPPLRDDGAPSSFDIANAPDSISVRDALFINAAITSLSCDERAHTLAIFEQFFFSRPYVSQASRQSIARLFNPEFRHEVRAPYIRRVVLPFEDEVANMPPYVSQLVAEENPSVPCQL